MGCRIDGIIWSVMTNPARTLRWRISPSAALTLRNSRVVHWLTSGALSATPCFSPARRMVAALARGGEPCCDG